MSDSDRYSRDGRYNNLHTDTRKEEEGKKDKYRIERLYIDSEKNRRPRMLPIRREKKLKQKQCSVALNRTRVLRQKLNI